MSKVVTERPARDTLTPTFDRLGHTTKADSHRVGSSKAHAHGGSHLLAGGGKNKQVASSGLTQKTKAERIEVERHASKGWPWDSIAGSLGFQAKERWPACPIFPLGAAGRPPVRVVTFTIQSVTGLFKGEGVFNMDKTPDLFLKFSLDGNTGRTTTRNDDLNPDFSTTCVIPFDDADGKIMFAATLMYSDGLGEGTDDVIGYAAAEINLRDILDKGLSTHSEYLKVVQKQKDEELPSPLVPVPAEDVQPWTDDKEPPVLHIKVRIVDLMLKEDKQALVNEALAKRGMDRLNVLQLTSNQEPRQEEAQ